MPKPGDMRTVAPPREPEPFLRVDVRGDTSATVEQDCDALLRILDAVLAEGIADAEAGRTVPVDEAFARVRTELGWDEAGTRRPSRPNRPIATHSPRVAFSASAATQVRRLAA